MKYHESYALFRKRVASFIRHEHRMDEKSPSLVELIVVEDDANEFADADHFGESAIYKVLTGNELNVDPFQSGFDFVIEDVKFEVKTISSDGRFHISSTQWHEYGSQIFIIYNISNGHVNWNDPRVFNKDHTHFNVIIPSHTALVFNKHSFLTGPPAALAWRKRNAQLEAPVVPRRPIGFNVNFGHTLN